MKKMLMLALLGGLALTGCGGPNAAEPVSSATAVAVVNETVTVPNVVGLTLDKATDQLEELGLDVEHQDIVDGKSIWSKKNWLVMSQDAAKGTRLEKGATVKLGVKSLEKIAEEKAAADKAAVDKLAAETAAAAKKAADERAAPDKAAAQKAAAEQAPAPPAVPVAPAPAAVYYPNCAAARAAGAAPVYQGTPGYGTHLDRDRDGIGCDK